jgi:hypothetical protein
MRALVQRINRKIAHDGKKLHSMRKRKPIFYVVNTRHNSVGGHIDDAAELETWAPCSTRRGLHRKVALCLSQACHPEALAFPLTSRTVFQSGRGLRLVSPGTACEIFHDPVPP